MSTAIETRIRVEALDGAGQPVTLRLSDRGHAAGADEGHADWIDDLEGPPILTRSMGADLDPAAPADTGVSAITLANRGGQWDHLRDWAWGRPITVLEGPAGAPTAQFAAVLTGVVERADAGWSGVDLILRDRLADLRDRPITEETLAGTSTGGGLGAEGGPSLAGRPVPTGWGTCEAITPIEANASDNLWRIGPYDALTHAADGGAVLMLHGTGYPDLAALLAATLSPGEVAGCPALGVVRPYGVPEGAFTVSARFHADTTAGALARAVLEGPGGLAPADILAAVDALPAWDVGTWTGTSEATVGEVLDALVGSVGAWWHDTATGQVTAFRLIPPEMATPTVSLTSDDLTGTPRLVATGAEVPAGRIELEYRRAWTVLESDRLRDPDGIPERLAYRDLVSDEYRMEAADLAAVQARWPNHVTVVRQTVLATQAAAQARLANLEALFDRPRRAWRLGVTRDAARGLDLGACMDLSAIPRLGMTQAWVVGLRRERVAAELTVWG